MRNTKSVWCAEAANAAPRERLPHARSTWNTEKDWSREAVNAGARAHQPPCALRVEDGEGLFWSTVAANTVA